MVKPITGNWEKGYYFDKYYAPRSQFIEYDDGSEKYTEMGGLIYDLKYNKWLSYDEKLNYANDIMNLLQERGRFTIESKIDYLVPMPATNLSRDVQPVYEIAKRIGRQYGITVKHALGMKKVDGERVQMKNNANKSLKRKQRCEALYMIPFENVAGKSILLLDDIMQTGATMEVATEKLINAGAKTVHVMALVHT